ncbi:MAG TPA: hypothetical protein VFA39_04345 [Steroidobacteraceae bacterium]|nr:hypothetical protein [Steroidobacteraceae bacterium]
MSDAETIHLAEQLRARAQSAYRHMLGAEPPLRMSDESLTNYRVRLLEPVKSGSKTWRSISRETLLASAASGALSVAETQIYADAVQSIQQCEHGLREVATPDRTGRLISRFYGDPNEVWGPFKAPSFRTSINPRPAAGAR